MRVFSGLMRGFIVGLERMKLQAPVSRRGMLLGGAAALGLLAACGNKPQPTGMTKKECGEHLNAQIEARKAEICKGLAPERPAAPAKCEAKPAYAVSFGVCTVAPNKGYQGKTYKAAGFDVSILMASLSNNAITAEPIKTLPAGITASLGEGVKIENLALSDGKLTGDILIEKNAAPGGRKLTVAIDGKEYVTDKEVFTVNRTYRVTTPPDDTVPIPQ